MVKAHTDRKPKCKWNGDLTSNCSWLERNWRTNGARSHIPNHFHCECAKLSWVDNFEYIDHRTQQSQQNVLFSESDSLAFSLYFSIFFFLMMTATDNDIRCRRRWRRRPCILNFYEIERRCKIEFRYSSRLNGVWVCVCEWGFFNHCRCRLLWYTQECIAPRNHWLHNT